MDVTAEISARGHEQVVFFADRAVGLRGIVAVHSTVLGPALGGIRFWHYPREADALVDALRLSEAMTMKAAVAGLDQGGGKAVVLVDDPPRLRDEAFRRALGRAVHLLGGRYVAAEDVGATQADMDGILLETPYVTGIDPARGGSGDPSPVTAHGVVHGIHAVCREVFGDPSLAGRRVVVQGAGHVGGHLVALLAAEGASVGVADVDAARARAVADRHGAEVLPAAGVLEQECDVLAPCALGGVLTLETVARLRCRAVCGAANNQLLDAAADDALAARGIVYAPDFVVNAGGIVNIAQEWAPGGYALERALAETARIEATTARVLALSRQTGVAPGRAALDLARERLAREGHRPWTPGDPHPLSHRGKPRAPETGA